MVDAECSPAWDSSFTCAVGLGSYQSTREVRSVDLSGARASQVFAGADTSFVITGRSCWL